MAKRDKKSFFDIEADEGADSDDEGRPKKGADVLKDAYYNENELKRKNRGLDEKLRDMEDRARVQDERRIAKETARLTKNQGNDEGIISDEQDESIEADMSAKDEDEDEEDRQKKLPGISDPKLWQVRVKKGSERIAAMALMNKMVDYAKNFNPLSIISATFVENIENFIFVEAYKMESVKEAIEGLQFCYFKIDILPLEEMTKIYENQDSMLVRPEHG